MKIKKGERLTVRHSRKGVFNAIAKNDFDTEKDEWYPVVVDQDDPVQGLREDWEEGEEIPCRRGLAAIIKRGTLF